MDLENFDSQEPPAKRARQESCPSTLFEAFMVQRCLGYNAEQRPKGGRIPHGSLELGQESTLEPPKPKETKVGASTLL